MSAPQARTSSSSTAPFPPPTTPTLTKTPQNPTNTQTKQVAGKNAFHLLRLRDYEGAAALFLLPQPPALELCLDVLVRHVKDPGACMRSQGC